MKKVSGSSHVGTEPLPCSLCLGGLQIQLQVANGILRISDRCIPRRQVGTHTFQIRCDGFPGGNGVIQVPLQALHGLG